MVTKPEHTAHESFVRDYEPGDEAAITRVMTEAFGASRSPDEWRWWHFGGPGGQPYIRVLVVDGEVAGHAAVVFLPTFIGGRLGTVSLGGDLAVLRHHQGQGLSHLLKAKLPDEDRDVRVSFPTDKRIEFLTRSEPENVVMGRMTQWVRWHTADAIAESWSKRMPRPLRAATNLFLHIERMLVDRRAPAVEFERVQDPGQEFDSLAAASASFASCIRVRDARYVRWRWIDNPTGQWSVWSAWRAGELMGWIVTGQRRGDPPSTGRIVDLLAPDARTMRQLLSFAATDHRAAGRGLVTFELNDPRPFSRGACLRAGFLPRGIAPNVTLRILDPALKGVADRIDAWYLTMGDTDLV